MIRYQHKNTHHNDNIFPNFPCFQLVYELRLSFGFKSRFGTFAMEACLWLDSWWQRQWQWHFEERKQGLAPSQTCISSDWRTDAPNHGQQLKRNWNTASHYYIVDHLCDYIYFCIFLVDFWCEVNNLGHIMLMNVSQDLSERLLVVFCPD